MKQSHLFTMLETQTVNASNESQLMIKLRLQREKTGLRSIITTQDQTDRSIHTHARFN